VRGIRYVTGDATRPSGDGLRAIVHCCNNFGAWGAGFVVALSKVYPEAERSYREWDKRFRDRGETLPLGGVQMVPVGDDVFVFNVVGQEGVGTRKGQPPIRYEAIRAGLATVRGMLEGTPSMTVHMPRMGAGLAGGDWLIIERIVHTELVEHGIGVTVYDLPRRKAS
jgi:O-acetyl-ADP-ribose deacetylase (regulator of RNase III)